MCNFTPNHRFPKSLAAISERGRRSLLASRAPPRIPCEPPSVLQPERRVLEATIRLMAVLDEAGQSWAASHAARVAALQPDQHLLEAAIRLIAELDEAGQFRATAYASMVADAIRSAIHRPLMKDGPIDAAAVTKV
jgi:hypothetical protein